MPERPFCAGAPEDLRLVVDAGIAILDVKRVGVHGSLGLFKSNADQEPLRPTVTRSEREIPDAVEDRPTAVNLKGLNDVGMMADQRIGSEVHGEMGFVSRFLGRHSFVGDPPMERHHDPVDDFPKASDVGLQSGPGVDGDARQICCRGAPEIPVIAEKTNAPFTGLADRG